MQPAFDWIGPLIVLLIFSSIMAMLGWLFAVRPRRAAVDRVSRNTAERQSILVSFTDSAAAERAVELACQLAPTPQTKITLAYVIEVPLSLALTASLPDVEERARAVLNTTALKIKQEYPECESRMVRERTIAAGLIRLAREAKVDVIVIGVRASLQTGLADLVTVSDLFRHAPCELVVAKEPTLIKENVFQVGRVIDPPIRA